MSDPTKIGKYRVVRELGRGTSSRVYLGRDPFSDRMVAIKVMLKESQSGNARVQQLERIFQNEAALAGRLSHPHIIEILDADVGNQLAYIVMEYVDGHTVEHFCKVDTLMPMNGVVELAFKCALALDFASRKGVIHRDIKPANILVGNNGDVKLTDFGIALRDGSETTQLQGVGSPTYMSPEQIREEPLTHQTDIYSLGIVMYRMLTGKLPFVASNNTSLAYQIVNVEPLEPSLHRPDLPADLDRIVMKAIAKDLSKRYQTWNDFAQDLGKVNKDLSLSTDSINETEKFSAIQKVSYFKDFADLEIWEMVRIATFRRVQAKETIVPEGGVCESFYLIVTGEARVRKGGQSLSVLGDGDCFGEMPYFEERGPRTSSVVAITPMTLIEVNSNALRLASDACQKQFNRGFLRILLDRIDRLSKANTQLVQSMRKLPEAKQTKIPETRKPDARKLELEDAESKIPVSAGSQSTGVQSKAPAAKAPESKSTPAKPAVAPGPQSNGAQAKAPEAAKPEPKKPQPIDLNIELPELKKAEPEELKIELPETKKPEAKELKIELPVSKPAATQGPKSPAPATNQPESQGSNLKDPGAGKPAPQAPKSQTPTAKQGESPGLKLEDAQPAKAASQVPSSEAPASKQPEPQGLKLEDAQFAKAAPQAPKSQTPAAKQGESPGLKLEDAQPAKAASQVPNSGAPASKQPEPPGLKLEDAQPAKAASQVPSSEAPASKQPESHGLKLEDPEPVKAVQQEPKSEAPASEQPESHGLKLQDPEPTKPASQGLKLELVEPDQAESTAQTR